MIVVSKIHSGLGNQMFHFATGYALAKRAGLKFGLDKSWFWSPKCNQPYDLDLWQIRAPLAVGKLPTELREHRNPFYQELELKPCTLSGHWQSERYFLDAREDLLELFRPRKPRPTVAFDVAIHVRWGDRKTGRSSGIATPEYYAKAIDRFRQHIPDAMFAAWSDDPDYARKSLPECVHVQPKGGAVHDLYAMSQCSHQIIANSSYSWWAAWLNQNPDKRIIWPELLTHDIPPVAETDYIPESWRQP